MCNLTCLCVVGHINWSRAHWYAVGLTFNSEEYSVLTSEYSKEGAQYWIWALQYTNGPYSNWYATPHIRLWGHTRHTLLEIFFATDSYIRKCVWQTRVGSSKRSPCKKGQFCRTFLQKTLTHIGKCCKRDIGLKNKSGNKTILQRIPTSISVFDKQMLLQKRSLQTSSALCKTFFCSAFGRTVLQKTLTHIGQFLQKRHRVSKTRVGSLKRDMNSLFIFTFFPQYSAPSKELAF